MKTSLIIAIIVGSTLARDTHLSPEDWENAKTYQDPPNATDPIHASPGLYQMDIREDDVQRAAYIISARNKWWPRAEVPYVIRKSDENGIFGKLQKEAIAHAMLQFHEKTVVRFTPRTTERHYIRFVRKGAGLDGACWTTTVGRSTYRAMHVNLSPPTETTGECTVSYAIQHELMHVLGFFHEQSRSDRDEYVTINNDNIDKSIPHFESQFTKRDGLTMGLPYDYYSIMHYGQHFCARKDENGKLLVTITTKDPKAQDKIGNARKMSELDVKKIN